MQQFSLYHTNEGSLYKTTCLLAEKSYHNNLRIVILTPDLEVQELLNKILWAYSQKQFIPHGSKLDPLPEKQPIYITDEICNPNEAVVLMVIAPFDLETILMNKQYIPYFQRIIIIYDSLHDDKKIIATINKLSNAASKIDCYKQSLTGAWIQAENK